jgi:DNA-binding CsgD family transcriptional regulator
MSQVTFQPTLSALGSASVARQDPWIPRGAEDEGAETPAPTGLPDEPKARRKLEAVAPAVISGLVTLCIGADFAYDLYRNDSPGHLAGMFVGTILSVVGLILILRILRASRAQVRDLESALDHTRADNIHWREQAGQLLGGIGVLIDEQFSEWELSPSEREVGLLLLKGLSLRSIAAARSASEPTVRQQAQAVYRKAKLAGRAELAAFFLEDLLLPKNPDARPTPIPGPAARPTR